MVVGIIIIIILLVLFIADFLVTGKIFDQIFARSTDRSMLDSKKMLPFYQEGQRTLAELDLSLFKDVSIQSEDGLKLVGKVWEVKNSKKIVIAFHGYHAEGFNDMGRFAQFYHDLGYTFCMISQRSHSDSEGSYITFGSKEQEDGIIWCNKMLELYGNDCQIILHGISMGAATVMLMSGNEKLPAQVIGIIEDCGYSSLKDELRNVMNQQTQLPVEFTIYLLNFYCQRKAGFKIDSVNVVKAIEKCQTPILFIHGEDDDFVPTKMVNTLYDNCKCQKDIYLVENAVHASSFTVDNKKYEQVVQEFIGKVSE